MVGAQRNLVIWIFFAILLALILVCVIPLKLLGILEHWVIVLPAWIVSVWAIFNVGILLVFLYSDLSHKQFTKFQMIQFGSISTISSIAIPLGLAVHYDQNGFVFALNDVSPWLIAVLFLGSLALNMFFNEQYRKSDFVGSRRRRNSHLS